MGAYQPVSTIQALNWIRRHVGVIRFWPGGCTTVEAPGPLKTNGTCYGEGDTLVLAVCAASRDAWERGWDLNAREAKKRSGV
jgi:hypothetical protein